MNYLQHTPEINPQGVLACFANMIIFHSGVINQMESIERNDEIIFRVRREKH